MVILVVLVGLVVWSAIAVVIAVAADGRGPVAVRRDYDTRFGAGDR